jgi:hypothetical protein
MNGIKNFLKFHNSAGAEGLLIGRVWDSQRRKPIALESCDALCDVTLRCQPMQVATTELHSS